MTMSAVLVGFSIVGFVGVASGPQAGAAATWSSPSKIDPGRNTLQSVSCPSASFCTAVDQQGEAFTYNGHLWSSPSGIGGSYALQSVSCPSASFCAAVDQQGPAEGQQGEAFTYNGTSWSPPSVIVPS
jgi:hypothetical protein